MVRAAIALLLFLLAPSMALAAKRVALVVGNSAYLHTTRLENPKNDATDVAAALKKLGFEVIDGFDLNKSDFERKVRDFSVALRGAEAAVFFYAGHGLQVAGQNYLVPVDAKAETADALDWEMLRLDLVHRTMERSASTNIIFLDACRNNPLARNLARAMGTRSVEIGRGLAPVESGVGTLISFSTQPGNVALDGSGRNSPFAGSLVKRIASSNDDLSALLIDVRNDVRKDTQNKQVPWEHSALTGRFYFTPKPVALPPTAPLMSEAERTWPWVKDSTNQSVLENFIKQFGDTEYGARARTKIEELKKQEIAVATPPPEAKPKPQAKRSEPAAVIAPAPLPSVGSPNPIATIAALQDGKSIIWIDTDQMRVTGSVKLDGGASLIGFDVRPADGRLYGVTPDGAIIIVDYKSGKWEKKSQLSESLPRDATFAVDFNPVADRLRILSSTGMNLRVNVEDGKATVDGALKYAEPDANRGKQPKVTAAAYSDSVAGTKDSALYDIDAANGTLVRQGPQNDGILNTIGMLGAKIDGGVAFDIRSDGKGGNTGWLLSGDTLYIIDMATGAAKSVGKIAGLKGRISDIAALPAK